MRLLYITSFMPYGSGETFLIDEIRELLREHELLIVPRSPGKLGPHAEWLAPFSLREKLVSPGVFRRAMTLLKRMPGRICRSSSELLTGSPSNVCRNLAVLPKSLWLAAIAMEWKADHIHCHWAGTTATMAMIASRLSDIPWSFTAHRFDIVADNLLRDKARSATMVRAISEDGRNMLLARGVDNRPELRVIPMGVSIPEAARRARSHPQIVLCPANLLAVKGHRFLIEAWRLLCDAGCNTQLWIAGNGPLRRQLEELVIQLGLTNYVQFLGQLKHATLLDYYKAGFVSAVVLASLDLGDGLHEGVPVALVEAMSYGIPVVATATGGIPELVRSGTGILVPPSNSRALAQALHQILGDDGFAANLGDNARRWIAESRDIKSITSKLVTIWKSGVPVKAEASAR